MAVNRRFLPFNHPIRVAEQLGTLNILSNGRAEPGGARSNNPYTLDGFGVNPALTREYHDEHLKIFGQIMTQGAIEYESDLYKIPKRRVSPLQAGQRPIPVHLSATSIGSHEEAGAMGVGVMSGLSILGWDYVQTCIDARSAKTCCRNCIPGRSIGARRRFPAISSARRLPCKVAVMTSQRSLSAFKLPPHVTQNAVVRKAAARGTRGVVVTQSRIASEIGVAVLDAGGNAADAAVAAAFALASAEPWNSGLGGIGFGLVRRPDGQVEMLDFGPVSPAALAPEHFPTTGRLSADIFAWPEVEGNANVNGSLSFCIPSAVAGYGLLQKSYGRLPREDILAPAVAVARRGLATDSYATVKIAQSAAILRDYSESARIYLPNGTVPVPPEQGTVAHLRQGSLADTIERIRVAGYDDFYTGELAATLLADIKQAGGLIDRADLESCAAHLTPAPYIRWGEGRLFVPGNLTAAPTLQSVMARMNAVGRGRAPDADWYVGLAAALRQSYAARLSGSEPALEPSAATCTTHLAVMDADGMTVSLTSTLLGTMGSRLVLPGTGVLMNNGAMWFDPRPGRSNSVAGRKRPLTNMLPVIFAGDDGRVLAAGASGGRRILASVYQMLAHILDFGMDLDAAAHQPRIDVSGPDRVTADRRLDQSILAALADTNEGALDVVEHGPVPVNFACPSAILSDGKMTAGIADTMTPWSAALAQ